MANVLIDARDMIQAENHATRIPVVLCLDTSGSMGSNGGYEALNEGVSIFYETSKNDPVNRLGFDVAIVTFGGNERTEGDKGVSKYQEFRPIWNQEAIPQFDKPENGPYGTPLGRAVDKAMKGIEIRKKEYQDNSIGYYKPFLIIITDGQSTEIMRDYYTSQQYEANLAAFRATQQEVVDQQKLGQIKVIAVGVGNEDYAELANFVVDKKILLAKDFSAFGLLFECMSMTMSRQVALAGDHDEVSESPLTQIMEDMEDEGEFSMSIEDFGRDED